MPGHPMVRTASGTHVLQPSVNFGDQPGVENLSTRCLSLRIVRGKNSILQRAALQVVRGETAPLQRPIKKNRKDEAIQSVLILV